MSAVTPHLYFRRGSNEWHATFWIQGKRVRMALAIEIAGTRPPKVTMLGDHEFEKSRARAISAYHVQHGKLKALADDRSLADKLTPEDQRYESVALTDMMAKWEALPEERGLGHIKNVRGMAAAFVGFMGKEFPTVKTLDAVSPRMASRFMAMQEERGIASQTFNHTMSALKTIFNELSFVAGLKENPFQHLKKRAKDTVHRVPFSHHEMKMIFDALKANDYMRPIIVTAACTALRRTDVCLLKWRSINWEKQVIAVRTMKTNKMVWIPIFALLREELLLSRQGKECKPDDYVFPDQARRFLVNPDNVTEQFKKLLVKLGLDKVPEDGVDLSTLRRLRAPSQRDIHSLRVTWATIALMAGVPAVIVTRITGHTSVQVLTEHYFQPQNLETRSVLAEKMPEFLVGPGESTNTPVSPAARLAGFIEQIKLMNAENWLQIRDQLLVTFGKMADGASPDRN